MPKSLRRSEAKRGVMNTGASRGRAVLVIDDDEVMRELLFALLTLQGDAVNIAASGEEALALLGEVSGPEVVLTDLQMPGLEGAALVTALRNAISPDTLLVGMSGSRPSEAVLHSLDAFVAKPFATPRLDEAISAAKHARQTAGRADTPGTFSDETNLSDQPHEAPATSRAASTRDARTSPLDEAIFSAMASKFQPGQLRELYTLTLDDIASRHARMERFILVNDFAAVQREAHSIKGLCGMVGAWELQELATVLEGGITLNTSMLADFQPACLRLQRMLDAKFQVT